MRKCERPKYAVLRTMGAPRRRWLSLGGAAAPAAEVRLYAPYLVAEVLVEGGDMKDALSSGFRQV